MSTKRLNLDTPRYTKYSSKVAGGAPPAIPALEATPTTGRPMAQQAEATRRLDNARTISTSMGSIIREGSIVVPDSYSHTSNSVQPAPNVPLMQQDLLPESAMSDINYRHGAGSRMASAQPALAAKYGVVRNGKHLTAEDLVGSKRQQGARSPEDIAADMRAALSARSSPTVAAVDDESLEPPPHLPRSDKEAIEQAKASPSAYAERALGGADASVKAPIDLTDADLAAIQSEMIRDILRSPNQREVVEARCSPLSVEDLILHNTVRQRVPIIPGKFEPTFESMRGDVELAMKQLLIMDSKSIQVTDSYLLDKYAVMTTAAGLVQINNTPVPSMFDNRGDFSEELFWTKFRYVIRKPIHMLASLGTHYAWFEQRVRKLMKADEGKGG